MRPRLTTIKGSHYCEKGRWGLERCGIDYEQSCHAPVFHVFKVRKHGGKTVPVLETDEGVFNDSTAILQWADAQRPGTLYPTDADARREVEELEDLFDEKLGPHTRRWAYSFLLPHRALILRFACQDTSFFQRGFLRVGLPLVVAVMRKAMNITPESAKRSEERVMQITEQVEERLADGRRYLVGDVFTAADLTFAALAVPLVMPQGYGAWVPTLDELPPVACGHVRAYRERPAGQFVLRLYAEERRPVPAEA